MSRRSRRLPVALPAAASAAAGIVLVSGCSTPAPEAPPSINFGSQASTTPGMAGHGTAISPSAPSAPSAATTAPEAPTGGSTVSVAGAVLFEQHIKPLFRPSDRDSMMFAFDLWSYTDVKTHAAAILDQIKTGSMPCDAAWPAERVAVLQRWVDSGMPQ